MKKQIIFGTIAALLTTGSAMADTNFFGFYAPPTYSGNVNFPSVPSEVTQVTSGSDFITLASTITARYNSPVVGVSGPGAFVAGAGYATAVPPGTAPGSMWNYDFYININKPADLGNFIFQLLYQATPGGAFQKLTLPNAGLGESFINGTLNDGQNLEVIGIPPFDPNATGTYTFELQALTQAGALVGQSVVSVNVVPETTSTLALFALVLGTMGAASQLRRKSVA